MGSVRLLFLLTGAVLAAVAMAGCARLALSPSSSYSQGTGRGLLEDLGNCGPADGPRCAGIHLSLARYYLDVTPLTRTAVDNADRELAMAAQNPGMAAHVRPWRRLASAWKKQELALETYRKQRTASATRIANLQKQNRRIAGRLHRLESLLQQEARKTVTRQH